MQSIYKLKLSLDQKDKVRGLRSTVKIIIKYW